MFQPLLTKVVLCSLAMILLGGVGGLVTVSSVDSWYTTLKKPPGTPPNWVFGPVWTALYFLIGVSFAFIWHDHPGQLGKTRISVLFVIQLVLNLAWTPVFFGAQQMSIALVVIIFLWIFIFFTIREFSRFSKLASYFLVPYLLWVTYATYLNAGQVYLN